MKPLDIEKISRDVIDVSNINYFESIDSTNSWLIANGDCGDICISESQTAGRGRRGNIWESLESGNIYFSMCCCLDASLEKRSLMGLVAGIATAEALSDIGVSGHGLKWPNDIFWEQRKLGGILIETSNQSEKLVIGIGLNVSVSENTKESIGQDIVTLDEVMNTDMISREQLISRLILRLTQRLDTFTSQRFDDFIETWKSWDILQDKAVSFDHQGDTVSGIVNGLDEFGRLGIIKDNGVLDYFSSADIKLRKNWSEKT